MCNCDAVAETMRRGKEQLRLADTLGGYYQSVSEHHYSPRIMTPSPMMDVGAVIKVVKRVKTTGSSPVITSCQNPVRVAEELAMLDAMSERTHHGAFPARDGE